MTNETSALLLGSLAPNFTAKTTVGDLNFYEYLGSDNWGILFCHPADFTPVCTTELGMVAKLLPEFEKRKCKVIGLSSDHLEKHHDWQNDIEETQGYSVTYPIIADPEFKVALQYGMIDASGVPKVAGTAMSVRSVFIIDPAKKVRLILTYPAAVGRNFKEVLRCLDALQLSDKEKIATPVNWEAGDRVIIPPSVSTEEAIKKYGSEKVQVVKSYLRYVDLKK